MYLPHTCQHPQRLERGVRSPKLKLQASESHDPGAGNQTQVLWKSRKCSWLLSNPSSPTKNTFELLLGDGHSREHQTKRKTVEFNLNIPKKSPTERTRKQHLDQGPSNTHTTRKEHVEPHPTLENRSVHLDQELYSPCLWPQFPKIPLLLMGGGTYVPTLGGVINSHLGKKHVMGGLLPTSPKSLTSAETLPEK